MVSLVSLVALVFAFELFLQARAARLDRLARQRSPRAVLEEQYRPFAVQHLHPQFLFFFPLDPAVRASLGNEVCSVDADGFREPGPARAAGRRLAFLLGGSAAFGYYASSNAATITSRLNELQDQYFFVNAGVPSWNSTQELMRVAFDIAARQPALIVVYDGANDAALAGARGRTGVPYPAGTPEFFDELEALAEPSEGPWAALSPANLLPEISRRVDTVFGAADDDAGSDADAVPFAPEAARRYLDNHRRMADLAAAAGARFVSVFQPIIGLHEHVGPDVRRRPNISAFHRAVIAAAPPGSFHDFSAVFDQDFSTVPVAGARVDAEGVFIDDVHLTDRGNALAAAHLWRVLSAPPPAPAVSGR
jgi:hypothetical protein